MIARTRVRCAAVLLLATAVAGCAGPSRTRDDFAHKAANTAEASASAAASASLVGHLLLDGRVMAAYASVSVSESESDLGSVQQTFDSVQPPDATSDALRERVDEAVQQAGTALAALRIAVRRDDRPGIRSALADLDAALPGLRRLAELA